MTETLESGDGRASYDNDHLTHDEDYGLDAGKVQQRLGPEAESAFVRAPEMEEGGIGFGVQHKRSRTLRKWIGKGAMVVFSPVSLPVRAILYAQRHWEELFWGKLEKAVRRLEAMNISKLPSARKCGIPPSSQDAIETLEEACSTRRKSNPGAFPIDLPSLAGSAVARLSAPPSSPTPPTPSSIALPHNPEGQESLAALRALEEARLEYAHLPLAHALNIGSSGRAQEPVSPPRRNGTISRFEMSRGDLERHVTRETTNLSLGRESTEALRECGLAPLPTLRSGHTIDICPPLVPNNTEETEPFLFMGTLFNA
jgi:hypothetical protein